MLISNLLVLLAAFTPSSFAADGYTEIKSDNGILFEYKIHDGVLDGRVTCDTTGWVAVGFDPENKKSMKNANIIIGYVDQNAQAHLRDDFGTNETHHQSDISLGGTDSITNPAGSEANGITKISFTIPLDSKDIYDQPLTLGKTHTLLLACGKDGFDNFVSIHKKIAALDWSI